MQSIANPDQSNKTLAHRASCQCKQCQSTLTNHSDSLEPVSDEQPWLHEWEEQEEEQFIGDLWNSITGAINQARQVDRNNPEYIKWVQRSLNQVLDLKLTVDGIGGPQTRSAIRSFQQRNGLATDGIVGERTEAKLIAAIAGKPAANAGYEEQMPLIAPTQPMDVTRWILPDLVRRSGESQMVRYDSPPPWHEGKNCTGSLTPGAKKLRDFLLARFPGIEKIGGYHCRQNSANAAGMSVHGTGRALDIMIATVGRGKANTAVGDPIANWLVQNAQLIGIQFVLWNRTKWNGSKQGRKDRPYTGPNPHVDHIHVELNRDGAFKNTAWFAERA